MIDTNIPSDFDPKNFLIDPIERSETIPSSWYIDPRMFGVDQDAIFGQHWQCVGHRSRVRSAGDYFLASVAGNPMLIVCGKDDVVRAFYNVCRHRGGPLAIEESGTCSALQCKYHGWTYLLDGSLRGVPQFDRVELFDKKDYGLVPVAMEEWEGLLFVNLAPAPEPLAPRLSGIRERIAPSLLSTKKFASRVEYDVRCNWKVYVDNYLEGYHLPYVHPELCNLLDYQEYVTEAYDHYSLQYSPFKGTENLYRAGEGGAYYFMLFPNMMLNILPGRLQTNLVLPITHDSCKVIFEYYYDDITSAEARKLIEDDVACSDRVQQEDIEICEHVQRGLASRAYDRGRFSVEMETAVYHFQCLLKKTYRALYPR